MMMLECLGEIFVNLRKLNPHFVSLMCVIAMLVLLGSCSRGNDYGATLPVPAVFPKISDVPPRPDAEELMSSEEKEAALREMQDIQQNHRTDAENAIEAQ